MLEFPWKNCVKETFPVAAKKMMLDTNFKSMLVIVFYSNIKI